MSLELVVGAARLKPGISTALNIEGASSGALDSDVHVFVADVVTPFDGTLWTMFFDDRGFMAGFGMPVSNIMLMFG